MFPEFQIKNIEDSITQDARLVESVVEEIEIEPKKVIEKPEDFIGRTFNDGKLKVVDIAGKHKSHILYRVFCTECSKDPELFQDGYFTSLKHSLINGNIPCGCSKRPNWEGWQYLIKAHRVAEKKGIIVTGYKEEYHGSSTMLDCECPRHKVKWSQRANDLVNAGKGCRLCFLESMKIPENVAVKNCEDMCNNLGYTFIGFESGYKNNKSYFTYMCEKHGIQRTQYRSFINTGNRCKGCWKDRQKELGNNYGYYPERKDEQDFLYVLNFNSKFIKIGRSFCMKDRIRSLRNISWIKNIYKLRIFTATHQEIYDYEQYLLNKLRPDFLYGCDWSTETLINPALSVINGLLDNTCIFKEIT